MNENHPAAKAPPEPISFSLGTLLLIVTCVGVALVAFRLPGRGHFEERTAFAMIFVGGFLTLWYLATLQFNRFRIAGAGLILVLVLSAIVFWPRNGSGPPSPQGACANNLKQIGLALLSYHQTCGSFPPAYVADANGKPFYSWRVLILPEIDQGNLAKMIHNDEAWDGPNNTKPTRMCLVVYNCRDDPQSANGLSNLTSYLAVVGPHTAWSGSKPRKLSDFKDPSKTILLVEAANSGVHWAEPRDLYVGQMAPGINPKIGQGISSDHAGGANVLFADGSIRFLPNATDPKKLAEMLDLDGCNDQAASTEIADDSKRANRRTTIRTGDLFAWHAILDCDVHRCRVGGVSFRRSRHRKSRPGSVFRWRLPDDVVPRDIATSSPQDRWMAMASWFGAGRVYFAEHRVARCIAFHSIREQFEANRLGSAPVPSDQRLFSARLCDRHQRQATL
jgi:prepilin-type processing-associated H-X9-DG protein